MVHLFEGISMSITRCWAKAHTCHRSSSCCCTQLQAKDDWLQVRDLAYVFDTAVLTSRVDHKSSCSVTPRRIREDALLHEGGSGIYSHIDRRSNKEKCRSLERTVNTILESVLWVDAYVFRKQRPSILWHKCMYRELSK